MPVAKNFNFSISTKLKATLAANKGYMKGIMLTFLVFANLSYQCFSQEPDSLTVNGYRKFEVKKLYAPSALLIAGVALNGNGRNSVKIKIRQWRNNSAPDFKTNADDYLQFSPIIIAYGLDAFGVRSRTDIVNRTVILIKGELVMTGIAAVLKHTTHQLRPDSSNYYSFPSGHTAQAFAAAAFLSEEYGQRLPWMPYLAYGLASSVGVLRVANNKHYISDVLLGAGLGILSMKLVLS